MSNISTDVKFKNVTHQSILSRIILWLREMWLRHKANKMFSYD